LQKSCRNNTEFYQSSANKRPFLMVITCKQTIKDFFLVIQTPHPAIHHPEHHTLPITFSNTTP
jgi:hypothetical protein